MVDDPDPVDHARGPDWRLVRVVRIQETVGNGDVIRLHHLTDLHLGAPDFAEDLFKDRVRMIEADSQARWTMGGDLGDLIRHNDRRYDVSSLHPRYRSATDLRAATMEHAVELLAPIADKCWGWADGNHERTFDQMYGGHFGVEMCCNLGIADRFVDYRGFVYVNLVIGSRGSLSGLMIDLQHGWQSGRLKGAFLVQAERELGTTDADIVLRGHNHQPAAHTFVTLGLNVRRDRVVKRMRTVLNGGCWRHGYRNLDPIDPQHTSVVERSMWHETRGYRSEPVGGPVLVLRFDAGRSSSRGIGRPASITHTTIEGWVDEHALGLTDYQISR